MSKARLSGAISEKDGAWWMRIVLPDGTNTRRKIGKAWKHRGRPADGYYTERQARAIVEKLLSQYDDFAPGSDPTFRYAAAEYLEHLEKDKRLRASTLKRYNGIIQTDLVPLFGPLRLSHITERQIIDLRRDLAERLSASSFNQTRIVLRGIFAYAEKNHGYKGPNHLHQIEPVRIHPAAHIEVYTPTEVEALARAARGRRWSNPSRPPSISELAEYCRLSIQDAAMIKTAAYAGLRMSELRALRWRDLDFTKATIFVRLGYTDAAGEDGAPKSGKGRTVPMVPILIPALDELSRREHFTAREDRVFVSATGGPINGSALYHRTLVAMEAAELRRLRFHDLRHCFGTLAAAVWPISDVRIYMGHGNITTTMRYLHHLPQNDAAEKLGKLIEDDLAKSDLLWPPFRSEASREAMESRIASDGEPGR